MSIVLKKESVENGGSGEMVASLRNTMFAEILEDNDLVDQKDIVIRDADSDDEVNQSEAGGNAKYEELK